MHVLAVIHGEKVRSGVFGDAVETRGHRLEEWSLAWGTSPPRPLDAYGAVLVFGGAMHADQDAHHPWLREENLFLQRLLDTAMPVFGICLGAQLLAKAAHADVRPADEPEIGWYTVELEEAAADDPLLGRLPARFEAFQWHYYEHGLPAGAVELARSPMCIQAFRLGGTTWGVQFHPEVTLAQVEGWLADDEPAPIDRERLLSDTRERIDGWNDLGRTLCDAFIDVAERVATPA
ncbi:MAG TPA: type 1 glutamine amidotransferase [Gaiellaceae bacterium]|jgi:GMP synthase (glutamine-hydrolysing)|nr:type 1 glutamine amidotransferase [Gaiellaceae bacterium]